MEAGLQLVWLGESIVHEQNPKQKVLCKFCFPLEGRYGLTCSLTTKPHKTPREDRTE